MTSLHTCLHTCVHTCAHAFLHSGLSLRRSASRGATALLLGGLPLASHAEACLYEADSATADNICVLDDRTLRARHVSLPGDSTRFTLRKLSVTPGSVAYLSDDENFDGRRWVFTDSVGEEELKARGIGPTSIAAAVVSRAACFYRGAGYLNGRQCFPPGPLNSYARSQFAYASSMQIPYPLVVHAFTDYGGRGGMATFRSSPDGLSLNRPSMFQRLRSVNVSRQKPPPVVVPMIIPASDAYDLATIFGGHMQSGNGNPYVVMAFDADPRRDFEVTYGARLAVRMRGQSAQIRVLDPAAIETSLKSDKRTRYYVVALELRPGKSASIAVMQMSADIELISTTPWLDVPWNLAVDQVLSIRNAAPRMAVRLLGMVLEVGPSHDRNVRTIECAQLALQGCPQAPATAITPGHPRITPLPPPPTASSLGTPLPLSTPPFGTVVLTNVGMTGNPLASAAARRACGIPQASGRRPLGLPGKDDCISRITGIVAMYQMLYYDLWNFSAFTAVIDNILARGTTGLAPRDPSAEQQLIEAVRWQTGATDTRRADALAAFHHANVVHAYSLVRTMNLEGAGAAASGQTEAPTDSEICVGTPRSIRAMSTASLGRYELSLAEYVPHDVRPRVWRNDRFVDAPSGFQVLRVQAGQSGRERQVLDTAQAWQREYLRTMSADALQSALSDECATGGYTVREFLASAGLSATAGIEAALLDSNEDNEILMVQYQGRPVAILLGTIPRRPSLAAEIRLIVSAPVNVVPPFGEGAVRGAGSAALHEFLKYCKERGIATVRVEAITEPSARIHQRAGFRLLDDLSGVGITPLPQ